MTIRKALVHINGKIAELPSGDTLDYDSFYDDSKIKNWINSCDIIESKGITSNSSGVMVDKIFGSSKVLSPGKYLVDVSYSWNLDSSNSEIIVEMLVDQNPISGTGDNRIHVSRIRNASNAGLVVNDTDSGQRDSFFGRYTIFFEKEESHDFRLSFRGQSDSQKASMWDTTIYIHKLDF